MKKVSNILWGIILIAAGVLIALNAFGVTDVDFFFDGWWTLFIIVPCAVGLLTGRDKTGNIIGILIGAALLLCCQGILTVRLLWKLVVPIIIIIIGIRLVCGGIFGNQSNKIRKDMQLNGAQIKSGYAAFSGQQMDFTGEVFEGAELTAIFGSVRCDLRGAEISRDCVIDVSAIFGGIDIFLPPQVNVKVNSNSIFGGMSDKKHRNSKDNTVTVYINGSCMFGGVEIE